MGCRRNGLSEQWTVPISDGLTLVHFWFNHEKFTPPPLRETTQKLLEGGGRFFFLISCPDFYRKNNLSGRKSQPPPPSVHKPCNHSNPSKVFFFIKLYTKEYTICPPPPPPSNNFCVVSRNGGGVNFSWLNPKCSSVRPSEIGTDISHVVMM
jgi:hypothetical protein